ncbi:MAG: alkaline phosphatase family protein [Actinomycetota bacterium]
MSRAGPLPAAWTKILAVVLVAGLLAALSVQLTSTEAAAPAAPPSVVARAEGGRSSACDLPPRQLLRVWEGTKAPASGEIQIVAAEPDYVGGGLSHAGPWDYVQRVPLLFYAPGRVPALGSVDGRATLADIAPTNAGMLDFDFDAPDGHELTRALLPDGERAGPPRLLVTLVWDGAGRNVLDQWPDDWPFLSSLIDQGAWFDDAEIGSSPSNTPPTHATIGTGAFPRRHGVIDLYQQIDGVIDKPQQNGPGTLLLPTLADLYDVAHDNEPLVGVVATLGAHTGMVGHGAQWQGGDADLAIMREQEDASTGGDEGDSWQLTTGMAPYFEMPEYVNDVPGLEQDLPTLDQEDGVVDEAWGDYPFDALDDGFQTPARSPYQTRIVEEVIHREGFGADEVPDLLYVNLKAIDSVGHIFSVNGEEVGQTLRWQDDALEDLVRFLDAEVGEGEWALTLTADHGHQYDPAISGALPIGITALTAFIEDRFSEADGPGVVRRARPTQIWMDEQALADAGHTVDEVAAALAAATRQELSGGDEYPGDPGALAFSAAFPTSDLDDLGCLPASARD